MRLLVPQSSCGFSALRVERVASLLWCLRFSSHSLLKSEGSERSGIIIPTLSTAPQLSSIRSVASLDVAKQLEAELGRLEEGARANGA
jgi:hypothetical protein